MFRYSMQLIWSDEDQEYVVTIPEFPYLNAVGQTAEEAVREAQVVADLFLEDMVECGEDPPEPKVLSGFRGEIRVRMPRTLHYKLAGWAAVERVSLNTPIRSPAPSNGLPKIGEIGGKAKTS